MRKDHNLDDLIINDIRPTKSKSLLTIIALLIALLIIAIVMTRLFLGEGDQNATSIGEKREELISPELKLDVSDHDLAADKKELDQLSSMMEETLINKTDVSPAELTYPVPSQANQIKPETTLVDGTDTQIIEKPAQKEPVPEEPTQEKQPQVQAPAKKSTPPVQAPVRETAQAPVQKPVAQAQPKKAQSSSTYYIQVGSFSTQPSKRFLSVITKNGFHYELKKGKLLIGPYSSDATARRDLPRVKSKINKSAFIKHF